MYIISNHKYRIFCTGGYYDKVLIRLGIKQPIEEVNWGVRSWTNCLEQLDYDADVVFFGDSLTRGGNWQYYFGDLAVVNLGYSGDNLSGMISRVEQIEAVSPEKIFTLGGINGLDYFGIDNSIDYYKELVSNINKALPNANIYIQSLLPVSQDKEAQYGSNENIVLFNSLLKDFANENGFVYIDIWQDYQVDGYLNAEYTIDGIHLQEDAYQIWIKRIEQYVYE